MTTRTAPDARDLRTFGIVPSWLARAAAPHSVRVYAWLAGRYANRYTAEVFAARRTIADDLGISLSTLDRAIADLEQLRALTERTGRKSGAKCYVLTAARRAEESSPVTTSLSELVTGDDLDSSPVTTKPKSSKPNGANAPARERKPITDEDVEELIGKWSERFGGDDEVRDEIEQALNHTARDRARIERLYVDGWLRREFNRRSTGRRGGGGESRYAPAEGSPGMVASVDVRETEFANLTRA